MKMCLFSNLKLNITNMIVDEPRYYIKVLNIFIFYLKMAKGLKNNIYILRYHLVNIKQPKKQKIFFNN